VTNPHVSLSTALPLFLPIKPPIFSLLYLKSSQEQSREGDRER
jgi:hypothetical protein